MALSFVWLLLISMPARAQMDPVPVRATPSTVVTVQTLPTLGGKALDLDSGKALATSLGPSKMGSAAFNSSRQRDAILRGLEAVARKEPDNAEVKAQLLRGIVEDELEHIEPRVTGESLTLERKQQILDATQARDVRWYHRFDSTVDPDGTGIPDGRAYPDGRIALFVKRNWTKKPDIIGHFRTLFAHEYTHRLQNDGLYSWKGEIPAYSTEILRALELFGLEGLQNGVLDIVGPGHMGNFDSGRAWTRDPGVKDNNGFYHRGFLAGAAYEAAVITGQWSDAWLYHRLVSTGAKPEQAKAQVLKEIPQP